MADYINNVAAADKYTDALTIGPDFATKGAVITVANNAVLMQFAVGVPGNWRWTDEREFFAIPQSFRVGKIVGVRFRNANAGAVARVLAVLSGDDDPAFEAGVPFSGILSAGGGVTPGAGNVEIDHNGVVISTQPKIDFEDAGANAFSVVDDPANTRAKITLPRTLNGFVLAGGGVLLGSGYTVVRNSVGNYTVNFNVAFPSRPVVVVTAGQDIVTSAQPMILAGDASSFRVLMYNPAVGLGSPVDQGFLFMVAQA